MEGEGQPPEAEEFWNRLQSGLAWAKDMENSSCGLSLQFPSYSLMRALICFCFEEPWTLEHLLTLLLSLSDGKLLYPWEQKPHFE